MYEIRDTSNYVSIVYDKVVRDGSNIMMHYVVCIVGVLMSILAVAISTTMIIGELVDVMEMQNSIALMVEILIVIVSVMIGCNCIAHAYNMYRLWRVFRVDDGLPKFALFSSKGIRIEYDNTDLDMRFDPKDVIGVETHFCGTYNGNPYSKVDMWIRCQREVSLVLGSMDAEAMNKLINDLK